MSDQSYMIFEIREKVQHFKDGQSFNNLSSLELEPIVKVYEAKDKIDVKGYIVLNGEFQKKQEDWKEQFEESDGIHYGSIFFSNDGIENFQYQIPVSFEIQREKVKDPEEIFIVIENFDYKILSDEEIEIIANLKLLGIYPVPKEEKASDSLGYQSEFKGFSEESSYNVNEFAINDGSLANKQEESIPIHKFQAEENRGIDQNSQDDGLSISAENKVEEASEKTDPYKVEKVEGEIISGEAEFEVEKEVLNHEEKKEVKEEVTEANAEVVEKVEEKIVSREEDVEEANLINKTEEMVVENNSGDNNKMKVGIKKKQDGEKHRDSEIVSNFSNPIYSLLKKDKEKEKKPEIQKDNSDKKEEKYVTKPLIKKDNLNKTLKFEDQGNDNDQEVIVMEEAEQDENYQANDQSEKEIADNIEEKSAKKTIGVNSTKDMLFSLLKEDEEKHYKIKIYFVKKEDTLESIGKKYGLKISCLTKFNKLEKNDLEEGQLLYLPDIRMIKNDEH